jgi:pimeloyl-ACP methyl ester carboxylesterase
MEPPCCMVVRMVRIVLIEGLGRSGIAPLLPPDFTRLPLPAWEGPALASYAPSALSDRMDELLPPGPCVVVGVSLGGSIALSMRSDRIASVVALDPPLNPGKRAPLVAQVNSAILPRRPDLVPFFAEALAEYPIRVSAPAIAVVGSRTDAHHAMPSLVSPEDRIRLIAAGVQVIVAPGVGHNVAAHASELVRDALRQVTCKTTR